MATQRYVFTFGQQYDGREPHPDLLGVTKDHYVEILAENANQARRLMFALTERWAFAYGGAGAEHVVREYCPAGRFMRIEVSRG